MASRQRHPVLSDDAAINEECLGDCELCWVAKQDWFPVDMFADNYSD